MINAKAQLKDGIGGIKEKRAKERNIDPQPHVRGVANDVFVVFLEPKCEIDEVRDTGANHGQSIKGHPIGENADPVCRGCREEGIYQHYRSHRNQQNDDQRMWE